MWIRTYSKTYDNVSAQAIWNQWSDVNNWHKWNPGVEYCKLHGTFAVGSHFTLKSKGGPEVKIELFEVENGRKFTDCSTFPGAKMYGIHELEETPQGLKLITTIKVEGWLTYLWVFILAKKIVAKIPEQTDNLVELARKKK